MTPDLERRLSPQHPPGRPRSRPLLRFFLVLLGLLVLAAGVGQLNLEHDLHRLDAGFLSGLPEGNYHAIAEGLVRTGAQQRARLREVPSEGSTDNIDRLRAARTSCELAFGLAQDGSDWGAPGELWLVGRLAKAESVFFLGKNADAVTELAQLRHVRIGVGPQGSGSAQLMRRLFQLPELALLGAELEHGTPAEQLEQVELAPAARDFFEHGGPELAEKYVPWLVDVMPPANWAYFVILARGIGAVQLGSRRKHRRASGRERRSPLHRQTLPSARARGQGAAAARLAPCLRDVILHEDVPVVLPLCQGQASRARRSIHRSMSAGAPPSTLATRLNEITPASDSCAG
ncbi:MAG: hypothetical protein ABI895_19585 [Deltaproteobacteria bacterium]